MEKNATSVSYKLEKRGSSDMLCPRDCSGNGMCYSGTCVCVPQFIDDDCSKQSEPLYSNRLLNATIEPYTWKYYSVNLELLSSLFELRLSKGAFPLEISFKIDGVGAATIPNRMEKDATFFDLEASLPNKTWSVSKSAFSSSFQRNRLLIGLYNPAPQTAENVLISLFSGSITASFNLLGIFIFVGVLILVTVIFGVVLFFKHRNFIYIERPMQNLPPSLTQEDIEKFFPSIIYQTMSLKIEQSS
eukprot:TRINITY_DN9798_c0_g1_i1.p1 TRINITY_DN9798_c0_g1~~TRINITY_DN9798_c0_g1_i1.p1  ORF type:complete len:245 (+),score=30.22 TRINITY_DN9798_c0_g1_i1:134-868(+)